MRRVRLEKLWRTKNCQAGCQYAAQALRMAATMRLRAPRAFCLAGPFGVGGRLRRGDLCGSIEHVGSQPGCRGP